MTDSTWTKKQINTIWRPFSRFAFHGIDDDKGKNLARRLVQQLSANGSYLKDDKTTTVAIVALNSEAFSQHKEVVVKRYNTKSLWHAFTRAVRASRAETCWQMSFAFAQAGIHVAEPILLFEKKYFFLNSVAYFVSGKIEGDLLLDCLPVMGKTERLKVVAAMEELFAQLERARLSHGDLKATNLLWDGERLSVIDLDAAKRHWFNKSWSNAIAKDRRRFLKNWRGNPELVDAFSFLAK
ncbi:MAG: lipopolysaccharide kinase InaA family protein [Pseudomonadota bacterium]